MFRFQHPWILWCLLVAIVPIWLHWRRRQPVRETEWAAIDLLRRAIRRQRLRWRMQDLVLLLLRTGTICVLVLTLAAPEWPMGGWTGIDSDSAPVHHLLLLDGSFSMQTIASETSRFDRARQQAETLIDRQPPGDRFSVWLADPWPRPILFPPSSNRRDVKRTLAALEPTAKRSDWSQLPKALAPYATEQPAGPRQGWLLSDLQKAAGFETIDGSSADWQQLLRQLPLQAIDVGDMVVDNAAVASLRVPRGRALVHEPCVIVGDIRHDGPWQELSTTVTLSVDGNVVARQAVRVPPRKTISVEFSHVFHQTGNFDLQIQTAGDHLAIDDQRFGVIDVVDRVDVVCLGDTEADTAYVAAALEAEGTDGTRFRVQRIVTDPRREPWPNVEVVVASNVARITVADAARWMRHVRGGGGLIIFLGGNVDGNCYARELTAANDTTNDEHSPFLPARIGPLRQEGPFEWDAASIGRTWLQRLADRDANDSLRSTPVWRYVQLDPLPGSEQLLKYSDGAAALVGHRWGDGSVILCGTPASVSSRPDEDWNALPVWPSFPPLVRELAWYAAQPRTANPNVGELIEGQFRGRVPQVEIHPPMGDAISSPTKVSTLPFVDGISRWQFAATDSPGIYRVVPLGREVETHRVAVNVDARESDLLRVDDRALAERLQLSSRPTGTAASREIEPPRPWQRWAFIMVAVMMWSEPLWRSLSIPKGQRIPRWTPAQQMDPLSSEILAETCRQRTPEEGSIAAPESPAARAADIGRNRSIDPSAANGPTASDETR